MSRFTAIRPFRIAPRVLILCCLGLLAVAGVRTCVAAEPATRRTVRIGIVEPIDGSGVPLHRIDELRKRLVRVDGSAGYGNRVRMALCADEHVTGQTHSIRGACGQLVTVPENWIGAETSGLYRGVILNLFRPSEPARRDRVAQWHQEITARDGRPPFQFDAEDLPSDAFLRTASGGVWLGCDWDANLNISGDEIVQLAEQGRPSLTATGEAITLVQLVDTDEAELPETLEIELWTPTSDAAARDGGVAAAILGIANLQGVELVWIDCGQPPYSRSNTAMGPADLAVAYARAAEHQCDAVVIDLQRSIMEPTQAARLVARLAVAAGIPAIGNEPTILSPEYVVQPDRQSVADLAEASFDSRPSKDALRTAIEEMIARVRSGAGDVAAVPSADSDTAPASEDDGTVEQWRGLLADAPDGALVDLAKLGSATSEGRLIGRVPSDVLTGSPRGAELHFRDLDDHQSARFYDHQGRLVTNPRPRSGGSVNGVPLLEAARSGGGFVTLQRHEVWRINGEGDTDGNEPLSLDFIHGRSPIVELRAGAGDRSRRIQVSGSTELSDRLEARKISYMRRLVPCDEQIVPAAVRASAEGLQARSQNVQSWWYRSDPWPGGNSGQFVVQDRTQAAALYDDDQLQLWRFWNQGTASRGSEMLGDVGAANRWVQWLLVEAVVVDGRRADAAPELIECMPHLMRWEGQNGVFERASHTETESGWVDDYVGTLNVLYDPLLEKSDWIWAGLHDPSDDGRLVRWMKIERADLPGGSEARRRIDQQRPPWWPFFEHDPTAEELQQRRGLGESPEEIVDAVIEENGVDTKDIVALRRLLLSLDQAEVRKQHLEEVIDTATRVIDACRQRLGGLPRPVDPVVVELLNTIGASVGASPGNAVGGREPRDQTRPDPFPLPDDAASLQTYAWVVDALYRQVRAIGYRELPEVVAERPIADQKAQDEDFERVFFQLAGIVDLNDPEFVLIQVRRQRRAGNPQAAIEHLKIYAALDNDPHWYFKKLRDLWDDSQLGLPERLGHARWFLRQINAPLPAL